ncbi:unnamed protein product [Vitrella brassicaformis CCMP3155]|uniref:Transcription factor CBF/NF-Y/archaeal histone domain-containing protein n=2 Tax=Vitrella brassicaformis TaxID=1169539 RepID=A0A0G4FZN1_VITBC|nr:unnamed protein product [Vitrella brassicaformis CCMP3155]|eukprot:CEM21090.1 unnamed protein product [Vitrella brassicaformis CCMP3155]
MHSYANFQANMEQMEKFWEDMTAEIDKISPAELAKPNVLPLARIKRIMKQDEDVKMIAAETPNVFSKACELFILDLTARAWIHTEENKRRTLQRNDISSAINRSDMFDFLIDIVPRDEGRPWGQLDDGPYYFLPSQQNPPPLPWVPGGPAPSSAAGSMQEGHCPPAAPAADAASSAAGGPSVAASSAAPPPPLIFFAQP